MRLTGFKKTVRLTLDRNPFEKCSVREVIALTAFNLAVFAAREVFNQVIENSRKEKAGE